MRTRVMAMRRSLSVYLIEAESQNSQVERRVRCFSQSLHSSDSVDWGPPALCACTMTQSYLVTVRPTDRRDIMGKDRLVTMVLKQPSLTGSKQSGGVVRWKEDGRLKTIEQLRAFAYLIPSDDSPFPVPSSSLFHRVTGSLRHQAEVCLMK